MSVVKIARPGSFTAIIPQNVGIHLYNDTWYTFLDNRGSWDTPDYPSGFWNFYKSTDHGKTWQFAASAYSTSYGANASGSRNELNFTRYGDKLYFAWQEFVYNNNQILRIGSFDLATESWDFSVATGTSTILNDTISPFLGLEVNTYYHGITSVIKGDKLYLFHTHKRSTVSNRVDIVYDVFDLASETFDSQANSIINGDDDSGRSYYPYYVFLDNDNWIHLILGSMTQNSIYLNPVDTRLHHIAFDTNLVQQSTQEITTDVYYPYNLNQFAVDSSRIYILLGNDSVGFDLYYANSGEATPTWSSIALPTPDAPYDNYTIGFSDSWDSYSGSLAVISGQVNVFVSSYYEDASDDYWTKLWRLTLSTDLSTWSDFTLLYDSPIYELLKAPYYSNPEGFDVILFSGVNNSLTEPSPILSRYVLVLGGTTLSIILEDSMTMNDGISLRLSLGSGGPGSDVSECPPIIVGSAYCTGFKDYSAGNEDPHNNCGNKWYTIQTEHCQS